MSFRPLFASLLAFLMMLVGLIGTASAETTSKNLTGVISAIGEAQITLKSNDHTAVITLTTTTILRLDGVPVPLTDLKTGMSAIAVTTDGITATEIRAYSPKTTTPPPATAPALKTITGTISAVSEDSITLKTNDHTWNFKLTGATTVKIADHVASIADLKVGMHAAAITADGTTATEIRAYMPNTTTPSPTTHPAPKTITGTISAVSGDSITLKTNDHTWNFKLTSATIIKIGDHPASIADLKVGMYAGAITADGTTATEIHAYLPKTTTPPTTHPASKTITGTISAVSADSITLKTNDHTWSFKLTSTTTVKIGDHVASITDLKAGMHAAAATTDGTTATDIHAYQPTTTK